MEIQIALALFAVVFFTLLIVAAVVLVKVLNRPLPPSSSSNEPIVQQGVRRVFRSEREKVLGGVCGGFAVYFQVDPVLIRLGWVLMSLITGFFPGAIFYILCVLIIPTESRVRS